MTERIKVGVTGAGGGVGQSIIKSLYDTEYEVVALDGELLGTGLFAVSSGYKIPYAKSPDFIGRLLAICEKENIKILFPGLDAELMPLALHREAFKKIGTLVVVSSPEVIDVANDKLITYKQLIAHGVAVPVTIALNEYSAERISFPLIVKQRVDGARSKNVYVIKTKDELQRLITSEGFRQEDFIAQEYIEGEEYTCGSVNWNNDCHGVIVMRRILRDGDTYKCFSVKNEVIEAEVRKVMQALKPFGACNVQLRLRDGKPFVFEINARCSGTTGARTLCGFNEPKMIADYLMYGKVSQYTIKELTVLRYWKELVVSNDEVIKLQKDQEIINFEDRRL